ncbi:MAG: DNRLRE domain-containing protein [Sedimentisphaerales bacterium]
MKKLFYTVLMVVFCWWPATVIATGPGYSILPVLTPQQEPFFPVGFWWDIAGGKTAAEINTAFQAMANIGCNVVYLANDYTWDKAEHTKYLWAAKKYNLKVSFMIYGAARTLMNSNDTYRAITTDVVSNDLVNPYFTGTLLGFSSGDELLNAIADPAHADQLWFKDMVNAQCPGTMVSQTFGDSQALNDTYLRIGECDTIGFFSYPCIPSYNELHADRMEIPVRQINLKAYGTDPNCAVVASKRGLIHVGQAVGYTIGPYNYRYPTLAEQRYLIWSTIASDNVRGALFFSYDWTDLGAWNTYIANVLKPVITELRTLQPAMENDHDVGTVTTSYDGLVWAGQSVHQIGSLLVRDGQTYYLILSDNMRNASDPYARDIHSVTITISDLPTVLRNRMATLMFISDPNKNSVMMQNGATAGEYKLNINMKSFESNIYKINGAIAGDMDGDDAVTESDVAATQLALNSPALYRSQHPDIDPILVGDIDGSGNLDQDDLDILIGQLGGASRIYTLTPDADCYVDNWNPDTVNNGSPLHVGNYEVGRAFNTLLNFTLPGIADDEEVSQAKLSLYQGGLANLSSATFPIYEINGTWSETTCTWNNQPAIVDKITEFTTTTGNDNSRIDIDLSEYVKSKSSGSSVNIMVRYNIAEAGYANIGFSSKDCGDANMYPRLMITIQHKVQPTDIVTASEDCYIDSWNPNTNNNTASMRSGNYEEGRGFSSLIRFQMPAVAKNEKITAAYLALSQEDLGGSRSSGTFRVFPITGSWTESTCTYNNAPALGSQISTLATSTLNTGHRAVANVLDYVTDIEPGQTVDLMVRSDIVESGTMACGWYTSECSDPNKVPKLELVVEPNTTPTDILDMAEDCGIDSWNPNTVMNNDIARSGQWEEGRGWATLLRVVPLWTATETLTNAYLTLYQYGWAGTASDADFPIYEITEDWNEADCTSNTQPSTGSQVATIRGASVFNGYRVATDVSSIVAPGIPLDVMIVNEAGLGRSDWYTRQSGNPEYYPSLELTLMPNRTPPTHLVTPSADCYIDSWNPTTTYNNEWLRFGNYEVGRGFFSLLRFQMPTITSADEVVTAAYLTLYPLYCGGDANQATFKLYEITGTWEETTCTWNTQPSVDANTVVGTMEACKAFADAGFRVASDVTDFVANTSSGAYINLEAQWDFNTSDHVSSGWYTKDSGSDSNLYPRLEITVTQRKATNPSPANSATGMGLNSTLSWTVGANATSHNVYFGTTSPGALKGNQAGTSFDPGTLTANTTYYWRIDEVVGGNTITGTVWGFTTAGIPGAATSPNPANSAMGVGLSPTLGWTAGVNAVSHNVYFGTTSPGAFQGNQAGTSFNPGTSLDVNTTYYWRIDEIGNAGTTMGSVWSFTVAPGQASSPSPANSATDVSLTPALSWTAGSGTTSHNIYFGTDSTPDETEYKGNQAGMTYVPGTLVNNTTYYWRIDEVGNGGTTTGTVWSFTTIKAVPTFVAAGAVTSGTGAITPVLPAGIATNDILLLFLETSNQAISISNQNGGTWTQVTNSPQYCGTAAGTTGARLAAFWSRYNGTQGAPTTSDSGDHQLGRMIAIRGAAVSGNPWDVTAGGVEAASDTSGSIPGATTTVTNTLVVTAIAASLPDLSSTTRFSVWTNANLTSVTERIDNSVTAGNGGGIGVATGVRAATGAYGNTAVTLVNAAYKGMMSIAIKP